MKIIDDKYRQFMQNQGNTLEAMGVEITPVDMYGRRVNLDKNDPTNLQKTADDIQDVYGMNTLDSDKTDTDKDDDDVTC